jgi:tRNA G18 (ribose-2'-O)-methylase SpoU
LESDLSRARQSSLEWIDEAIDSGKPIALLLVQEGEVAARFTALVERARAVGIEVSFESEREMRRMSVDDRAAEVLAVEGSPPSRDVPSLMASAGIVFLLVGLRYPSNVGFILRSAEVAGAAGVVVANDWSDSEWSEARRVSIHAERFFSVLSRASSEAQDVVNEARAAGRRIVAVETSGEIDPWQADLRRPSLVILGSETLGIDESILMKSDEVVRIPTRGFIPSYNVQAATGMVLGEWLRQSALTRP